MLKKLLSSITGTSENISSYKISLLQAKANRTLKQQTSVWLQTYHLSSLEWTILGILFDLKTGQRLQDIAELVGVEAPFVTVTVQDLAAKKLIKSSPSREDKRAKMITLSKKGMKLVPQIEAEILPQTKLLLKGSTGADVHSYLKVLNLILDNSAAPE